MPDILKARLKDLELQTRILQLFRKVNSKVFEIDFKMNNILIFRYSDEQIDENQSDLEIRAYGSLSSAIRAYNDLERDLEGIADVVLVRADNFDNLRIAFRNYFADTTDFVSKIDIALSD